MNVDTILRAKGRHVETIDPRAAVTTALDLLNVKGIGALVVSSDGRQVEGLVSEQDVVRGIARHHETFFTLQVADIMSRDVTVCAPGDTAKHLMETMTRTRQRHLPVVDDGQLAGIVSIGDVVKGRLEELEVETGVLRDAYPFYASR